MGWAQSCFEAKTCLHYSYLTDVTGSQQWSSVWEILPFLYVLILDGRFIFWWFESGSGIHYCGVKETSNNHYIFGTFWPFINHLGDLLTKDSSLGPLDFEEPKGKETKTYKQAFFYCCCARLRQVNGGSRSTCLVRQS